MDNEAAPVTTASNRHCQTDNDRRSPPPARTTYAPPLPPPAWTTRAPPPTTGQRVIPNYGGRLQFPNELGVRKYPLPEFKLCLPPPVRTTKTPPLATDYICHCQICKDCRTPPPPSPSATTTFAPPLLPPMRMTYVPPLPPPARTTCAQSMTTASDQHYQTDEDGRVPPPPPARTTYAPPLPPPAWATCVPPSTTGQRVGVISRAIKFNGRLISIYTTSIVNKIMTALTQPNIIILGLHGSSDANKHNVVEQITRRVERDGVFHVVVMASVVQKNTWGSKSPDMRRIQGELGNKLGLQLRDKTTLEERATLLCDKIKTNEKILIILDDLQGGINLAKIGIPFGNDHKGCKVLLVDKDQDVLSNKMKTQLVFSADASSEFVE